MKFTTNKIIYIRIWIIFILFLINFLSIKALIQINSCQDLNIINETYNLTNSLNSNGTCFSISAENITLDCNFKNSITGNYSGVGIQINNYNNIIIKNCKIKNFMDGIYFSGNDYAKIENIISNNNSRYGLFLASNSNKNTFNNITTNNNKEDGTRISLASNNSFNLFLTNNNSYSGLFLIFDSNYNSFIDLEANYNNGSYGGIRITSNSNNNLFSDFFSNYNLEEGITLELSNNNTFINGNLNYNGRGIMFSTSSNYNKLNNLIINNNTFEGVRIFDSHNNTFNKLKILYNNRGFFFDRNSTYNLLNNSEVRFNIQYNLYFFDAFSKYPINNLIYNNILDNSSFIISTNWDNTPNNFIGNYYLDYDGNNNICFNLNKTICDLNPKNKDLNNNNNNLQIKKFPITNIITLYLTTIITILILI